MGDHVDHLLAQWQAEMPALDSSPMAVIARVSRLGRFLDREATEFFVTYGLNRAQFGVLAALRRSGPPYCLSPTTLYSSLLISAGAMTSRLGRLETAGYIHRVRDPKDARGILVALTPSGKRLIERVLLSHHQEKQRMLSVLSGAEREQLVDLLRRLLLHFDDDERSAVSQPVDTQAFRIHGPRSKA